MNFPCIKLFDRHIRSIKVDSHEPVFPLALPAKARQLVLPHQNSGKTVGVKPRLPLAVGVLIKFTKGLPEWLTNRFLEDQIPPALNLLRVCGKRVPKSDFIKTGNIDRFAPGVAHPAVEPEGCLFRSLGATKYPDQSTAQKFEKRMFQENLSPMIEPHFTGDQKRGFQASFLRAIYLFQ